MVAIGITAVGGGVGQAVLQSINYSRLQWRTVGMDTLPLAPGLYWSDSSYLVPPAAQEDAYIRELLDIVGNEHIEVLIPGLDVELEPLARHREAFEALGCEVIVASAEAVRLSHDKLAFYAFCRQRGLPFVPTYTVKDVLSLAGSLPFPVIAKPRRGKASVGARLIHGRDDLSTLPRNDGLIVQEYLPPPSGAVQMNHDPRSLDQSEEWSVQFFVGAGGEILGHFVSVNELKEGIPLKIVPRSNSEVLERAREIVVALVEKGLRGPINIQGREIGGSVLFFEANTRFTGITGVRASMGYLELDAAVHALVHGRAEEAQDCLTFDTRFVGTRHVEHTTLPKSRIKRKQESAGTGPVTATPSKPRSNLGNVLVTGASGYIGANVVRHLLNQNCVRAIYAGVRNQERGEQIRDSLGYPDDLHIVTGRLPERPWQLDEIDTIIHLAAARPVGGETTSAHFFEVNAEGTRRLLESALKAGVQRFVFVSSQAVYGTRRRPPWSEMMAPQPETPYGLSKWIGEQLCANLAASRMDTVALRVARVFGEGLNMQWSNFPHVFSRKTHQESALEVYGDGKQQVDLVHISDVCSAVEKACMVTLPSNRFTVFNIGSGNVISVANLAALFQQKAHQAGLPAPRLLYRDGAKSDQWTDFGMDIRRAKAHLSWAPGITMETAVKDLLRAYAQEGSQI